MSSRQILEIACFNLESAAIAESSGADRIELCTNYKAGGLTPSYEAIEEIKNKIKVPVHVIIRPHATNFIYSEEELMQMEQDVLFCKKNRIDGIVFGILNESNEVNVQASKKLIALARPMSVTFHRAIDQCTDLKTSFETLITLGVDRVLTSGGPGNSVNNIIALKILQANFGKLIKIMPGGGVRASNIKSVLSAGFNEIHSAAITSVNEVADGNEIRLLKQLLTVY